ncbi:MAG: hypothetical protein ACWGQW_05995 [bacterium]
MAKKSMTIEEVKESRIALESAIIDLISTFEKDTGLKCTYMDIQRKRPKDKNGYEMEEPIGPSRGPVENVNVAIDFEELF